MTTTTTAVNAVNAVIKLDNNVNVLTDISGSTNKVSIEPKMEGGKFEVFGNRWKKSLDGSKEWGGSITIVFSTTAAEALDLIEDWFYATNPANRTLQVDVPDSGTGSRRYSGEIRVREFKYPFDRPEAGPVTVEVTFDGDDALTQTDL